MYLYEMVYLQYLLTCLHCSKLCKVIFKLNMQLRIDCKILISVLSKYYD